MVLWRSNTPRGEFARELRENNCPLEHNTKKRVDLVGLGGVVDMLHYCGAWQGPLRNVDIIVVRATSENQPRIMEPSLA